MKFRIVKAFLLVSGINVAVVTLFLVLWSRPDLSTVPGPRLKHGHSSTHLDKPYPTHSPPSLAQRQTIDSPRQNPVPNDSSKGDSPRQNPGSNVSSAKLAAFRENVDLSKAELSGDNSSQKFVFYYCPRNQSCGDWDKQQRAIVGVFSLAEATGRRFGIVSDSPCDLRNFYLPNIYDWDVPPRDLANKTVRVVHKSRLLKVLRAKGDVSKEFPEDVLYTRRGGYYSAIRNNNHLKPHLPSWWDRSYSHHFAHAWSMLMRPSPQLLQRQNAFLRELHFNNRTSPLVGVHVRIRTNESNPYNTYKINKLDSTGKLWNFVELYVKNGSQVFVASDSAKIRDQSRRRFGAAHHDKGGVILGVAKQCKDPKACQDYEDAIFNQLILTKSDVLIMSARGFSRMASYIRGSPNDLYVFSNGSVNVCQDKLCP